MFVRGLANITNISLIEENIGETPLGIVYPELRTKDDTLSMWHIEKKEDFLDAALNIVGHREKFAMAAFLIIDDSVLADCGIECKFNPPIREIVEDSKATHYDMINVRVNNIHNVLEVYRTMYRKALASELEDHIIQWTADETEQHIRDAVEDGKVKLESLNGALQKKLRNK